MTAARAPDQKPPITTQMTTGTTKTSVGVAMLRWERTGSRMANTTPCVASAADKPIAARRYAPLKACMLGIALVTTSRERGTQ